MKNNDCNNCKFELVHSSKEPCSDCVTESLWEPKAVSFDVEFKTLADRYPHYHKKIPEGVKTVDVYRVLQLFGVTDPCIQHAIKKLLVPGSRGNKSLDRDVEEAIVSLKRYQEMQEENKSQ